MNEGTAPAWDLSRYRRFSELRSGFQFLVFPYVKSDKPLYVYRHYKLAEFVAIPAQVAESVLAQVAPVVLTAEIRTDNGHVELLREDRFCWELPALQREEQRMSCDHAFHPVTELNVIVHFYGATFLCTFMKRRVRDGKSSFSITVILHAGFAVLSGAVVHKIFSQRVSVFDACIFRIYLFTTSFMCQQCVRKVRHKTVTADVTHRV
jgi:hypothetical protein